jgi:uncharacterized protein
VVTVEEAYIHCSRYIPKLEPVRRTRDWGTDDPEKMGGDDFHVAAERPRRRRLPIPDAPRQAAPTRGRSGRSTWRAG